MADTTTTNYSLTKPEVGASADTWGTKINTNLDTLDATVKSVSDVANAAIVDGAGTVDATNLAADSVGSSELQSNSVGADELQSNSVGSSELQSNSVGADELNVTGNGTSGQYLASDGDGTMTWTTLSSDPSMGGDLSGTASNAQIVANAVGTTEIANSAVTDAKISGMSSSKLTGALPAISGAALTNLPPGGSTVNVFQATTTWNGSNSSSAVQTTYMQSSGLNFAPRVQVNAKSAAITYRTRLVPVRGSDSCYKCSTPGYPTANYQSAVSTNHTSSFKSGTLKYRISYTYITIT